MNPEFIALYPDSKLPNRAHATDGGYDLFAYIKGRSDFILDYILKYSRDSYTEESEVYIGSWERVVIPTGVKVKLPPPMRVFGQSLDTMKETDMVLVPQLLITPKSGLAYKLGLSITNSPGLVDNTYPEEIMVILETRDHPITVEHGQKIAQAIPILTFRDMLTSEELRQDIRTGGFGSTGIF